MKWPVTSTITLLRAARLKHGPYVLLTYAQTRRAILAVDFAEATHAERR